MVYGRPVLHAQCQHQLCCCYYFTKLLSGPLRALWAGLPQQSCLHCVPRRSPLPGLDPGPHLGGGEPQKLGGLFVPSPWLPHLEPLAGTRPPGKTAWAPLVRADSVLMLRLVCSWHAPHRGPCVCWRGTCSRAQTVNHYPDKSCLMKVVLSPGLSGSERWPFPFGRNFHPWGLGAGRTLIPNWASLCFHFDPQT